MTIRIPDEFIPDNGKQPPREMYDYLTSELEAVKVKYCTSTGHQGNPIVTKVRGGYAYRCHFCGELVRVAPDIVDHELAITERVVTKRVEVERAMGPYEWGFIFGTVALFVFGIVCLIIFM